MTDVVTDTYALIWYLEDSPRLSASASQVFDRCDHRMPLTGIPLIWAFVIDVFLAITIIFTPY